MGSLLLLLCNAEGVRRSSYDSLTITFRAGARYPQGDLNLLGLIGLWLKRTRTNGGREIVAE